MEKIPNSVEQKERKEHRKLWSRLGAVALASSMAAACVEQLPNEEARDQAVAHLLAEKGMHLAGERPQVDWDTELQTDAKGYTTGEIVHVKIATDHKTYRIDMDLGPLHESMSAAMVNPIVHTEGLPTPGWTDPSSVSWFDLDTHGNGNVVKFTPVVDKNGGEALEVRTVSYKHGEPQSDQTTLKE